VVSRRRSGVLAALAWMNPPPPARAWTSLPVFFRRLYRFGVITNWCQHELVSVSVPLGASTIWCQHHPVSARTDVITNWCQHDLVSALRGVSTTRCQHELVSARIGVSTDWCQHELVPARFGVSTSRSARNSVSTTRCQHELVSARIGVSTNWCHTTAALHLHDHCAHGITASTTSDLALTRPGPTYSEATTSLFLSP
jgi:hypothetical protein